MHFDEKYGYFRAYHNSKIKFTLQPQKQKSGGSLTQYSSTPCGGYCTQSEKSSPLEPFWIRYFVVHFDEKYGYFRAYHNSKIKFTLQRQEQKSGGRVTQCSSRPFGGYCIQPEKSSPLEPFWIRHFVVHFDENYGYLCIPPQQNQVYSSTAGTKIWWEGNTML